jgi:glycosyltransferase involved in cell wall biosynthesis
VKGSSRLSNIEAARKANEQPLVSIVVPALNEAMTIGEFVDWCKEGLCNAGVSGQILIVDSSLDETSKIAEAKGAEVLRVPKRGLGRAYIDALPYIRGKYVIMGDCDLTYDFREIGLFVEKLENGYEFVMGSRFRGCIEPGAMPYLHRYFGTPITTSILNSIYKAKFTDIHCGMRAITLDALRRINLESESWEYAAEMVLKAAKLNLRIYEVPIHFYKDRDGRLSHHKRSGWLSPWLAGWINLKVMFLYAPDFFLMKPGMAALFLGLLLTGTLSMGPVRIGFFELNLHWMLLGTTLATSGYTAVQLGVLARLYNDFESQNLKRLKRSFNYNRGVLFAAALSGIGLVINLRLVITWLSNGLKLTSFHYYDVFGLLLIILGFQTFTFTLMFELLSRRSQRRSEEPATPDVGRARGSSR